MMTIDRLEELHTLTGQFSKIAVDAGYDSTAVDFAADVRSLIDAEIERQSVTDEGIAWVIAEVETWEDQANQLKELVPIPLMEDAMDKDIKLAPIILDALRAYGKTCEWTFDFDAYTWRLECGETCDPVDKVWEEDDKAFTYCPDCAGRIVIADGQD